MKPWKNTCGGSRSWNRWRWAFRASTTPTPSRPDARSGCWWTASRSTTPARRSLCREVARAIQTQLSYPGEVKVTVLRETRSVEFAR